MEYFLFYRWIFFKNRPRVNFLLLRAVMVVCTWFGLYYIFFSSFELLIIGVDVDPIILLGICIVVGFQGMSNTFAKKSVDCLKLYNDYLTEFAKGDYNVAKMLGTSLSLQLLMVDLYAHRNFSWFFAKVLEEAIGGHQEKLERFKSGKMFVREARQLLQTYLKQQLAVRSEGKDLA
jgi:hypothetical protein